MILELPPPLEIKENAVTKLGTTTIINNSSKAFFIPNKTYPEIKSFADNAPNYVTVSVCGDHFCTDGEDTNNCQKDCPNSVGAGRCGDGICAQTSVHVYYDPPLVTTEYEEICGPNKKTGWVAIGSGSIAGGAIGCAIGGVIGCAAGGLLGGIIGLVAGCSSSTTCNSVAKTATLSEGYEYKGEVYTLSLDPATAEQQQICPEDCAARSS